MIKTLIKLKILKFILISGVSAAYVFRNIVIKKMNKRKKNKKPLPLTR